jgi:hypothetical protein
MKGESLGRTYIQSLIVAELVYFFKSKLGKEFQVLTNELGLQLKNKEWRAADIAIVENNAKSAARTISEYTTQNSH